MVRFGIVILLLSMMIPARPAAAGTSEWAIDPPAGWRADADTAKTTHDQLIASKLPFDQLEVQVWHPEVPGAGLIVLHYMDKLDASVDLQNHIDHLDHGLLHGAFNATPTDAAQQVAGSMVVRDARVDRMGDLDVHARMVRRYQPARDGLHVLITICTTSDDLAPCVAPLDSVRFTVADPIPLEGERPDGTSYFISKSVTAIGGLLIVLLWLKHRMARASPPRPRG